MVIATITPLIQQMGPVVQQVSSEVGVIIMALLPMIQVVATVVRQVVSAVCGFIKNTLQPTVQAMAPFVTGLINNVLGVVRGITGVVRGVVNLVVGLINGNWRQAWQGFRQIVGGVVGGVRNILGGVGNIVRGCFAGAGSWLWNAGSSIINGLLNGLKSAFGKVKSFVSGIGDWIVKHKGPLSYDKVMLKPAGEAIMRGFDRSLKSGWKDVQRTIDGMNAQINGGFDVSKTGRSNMTYGSGNAANAGNTYVTQTFNYPAISPTSISTQQKLQTAAMPQW